MVTKQPIQNSDNDLNKVDQGQIASAQDSGGKKKQDNFQIQTPQISLPKGGGALKGIDEKFSVNSANGTSSFSIPLPVAAGRNGFAPSLTLSYNSGTGNSLFGLGWNVDFATIQRKTDKQLPRYRDGQDEDVFMFSGVEDLVPFLDKDDNWSPLEKTFGGYVVKQYRPRIEGAFSRIEKITPLNSNIFYWKVTTSDNLVTFFGRNASHRIADPSNPSRIFKWLPEFSFDDKGSCMEFEFKEENLEEVQNLLHERNRFNGLAKISNQHLKRIKYGNHKVFYPEYVDHVEDFDEIYNSRPPPGIEYFFELVFDYGEHTDHLPAETAIWKTRGDPFSEYRSGFEIRTYRLCQRVLMFHHFDEMIAGYGAKTCLVKSLDLSYQHQATTSNQPLEVTYLKSITQTGYLRNKDTGQYSSKSLPPMEFEYNELNWNTDVKTISPENIVNAPAGISGNYHWVDLYNEGIPGILSEQADAWYYKSNLGDGEFTIAHTVTPKPSFTGIANGTLQLQDLEANGKKQVVVNSGDVQGYFELTEDNQWQPFRAFEQMPNQDVRDPNARFLDLNGDGMPELVVSEENVFTWYPAQGIKGYDEAEFSFKPFDEEIGPAVVFADSTQSIYLADMSGDGLTDIVRIRNGEISYWPNMGYGNFGAKVNMNNAPVFDHPEQFNPSYLHLADVSGTGATDILYLGKNKFSAWLNHSGNSWSLPCEIDPFLATEQPNQVSVTDLLGIGTSCIVWSSPLPNYAQAPMRYIDLMGGRKPHIMRFYKNNFGKETIIEYKSSSFYYLQDKKAGTPWITKLPFPVQCVSRVEVWEKITNAKFVNKYSYHHGYFDHHEREFRGFGLVEQQDTESFDKWIRQDASNIVDEQLHQPPVKTKTWFHTGVFFRRDKILNLFREEYYNNAALTEHRLPEAALNTALLNRELTVVEHREALRACKGMVLRQEIYAVDGSDKEKIPYSVAEHNCNIRVLQPKENGRYAVFLVLESEAITYHYERNDTDPRIAHSLNTVIDEYGNILEAAAVVYKRAVEEVSLPERVRQEQRKMFIIYTKNIFTNDIGLPHAYRLRLPSETQTYEITGLHKNAGNYFNVDELAAVFKTAGQIVYEEPATVSEQQKKLIEHVRILYRSNDAAVALAFHELEFLALPYETYKLACTDSLIEHIYGDRVTTKMLEAAQYRLLTNGEWWIPSGTAEFPTNPEEHFYIPDRYVDPFGNTSTIKFYSDYHLLIEGTEDAIGNKVTAEKFDFRVLAPTVSKDTNDNLSDIRFDILGMVVGAALKGKDDEADDLDGFIIDLTENEINDFFADPKSNGAGLLQHASCRFIYDLHRYKNSNGALPVVVASIVRETHHHDRLNAGIPSKLQYSFEYSDGLGRVAMKKVQAEAGGAWKMNLITGQKELVENSNPRWIGNGRTVFNNKGKPVKQYEPYFSVTHEYENAKELVEIGVTPILFYDPVGRLIKTELPNRTFSKVEFDGWFQKNYDVNDTVMDSEWFTLRINGGKGIDEKEAAEKSAVHYNTPATVHLDSLGRSFYTIDHNKFIDRNNTPRQEFYHTAIELDIEGNQRKVIDARGNTVMEYKYDMLGTQSYQDSMDAGERWMFNDAMGKMVFAWGSRNHRFHSEYDVLNRPVKQWLTEDFAENSEEKLIGLTIYGEAQLNAKALNLRGKVFQSFDQSGITETPGYDFKGNAISANKRLTIEYKQTVDWNVIDPITLLETETFTSSSTFDALNRPIQMIMPDESIIRPGYNEAGLLETLQAFLNRTNETVDFVKNIDYDAKGQRERILYGNNTATSYQYEPDTFRLKRLVTTRNHGQDILQDLNYTYDPTGNITSIIDNAQQTNFFNNAMVEPHGKYEYDSVYRLIKASGREHAGQNAPCDQFDNDKTHFNGNRLVLPGDMNAMQRYDQRYEYDSVGNMLNMIHNAGNGQFQHQWTRSFECNNTNNQLIKTSVANETTNYQYDEHGNMLNLQNGSFNLFWNYADQLKQVNLGGGGIAYYVYDGSGQRGRKVIENGSLIKERIYLGGYEVYREKQNGSLILERDTMHIMDDKNRIALVENRTVGIDQGLQNLIRYQYNNHLGTVSLELDGNNASPEIISYEEYYPFASTAYQACSNQTEMPKRYRYTGKERDEESGLNYHGARYYASWLARWMNCDPAGLHDSTNVYLYVINNPIAKTDPTGKQWVTPQEEAQQESIDVSARQEMQQTQAENDEQASIDFNARSKEALSAHLKQKVSPVPSEKLETDLAAAQRYHQFGEEIPSDSTVEQVSLVDLPDPPKEPEYALPMCGGSACGEYLGEPGRELGLVLVTPYVVRGAVALVGRASLQVEGALVSRGLIGGGPLAEGGTSGLQWGARLTAGGMGTTGTLETGAATRLAVVNAQLGDLVVFKSAFALANKRGDSVTSLGRLHLVSSGERLSIVAHGTSTSVGAYDAQKLGRLINASGVKPSSIELVSCHTGTGRLAPELASLTGAPVRAPLDYVNVLSDVYGVPQVEVGNQLAAPGIGWRVFLPVIK